MYPVTHALVGVGAAKAAERMVPARWLPLDFRFAALGGLLPDLIDKPIAWVLVPSLADDHLWGHSAWLPAILMGTGLLMGLRSGDARLLILGLGAFTHLLIDPVGSDLRKLFWPLFGSGITGARGYLFDSPVRGQIIDLALITLLLFLPHVYVPVRRRISTFVMAGAV
jgi:hypothetical protein